MRLNVDELRHLAIEIDIPLVPYLETKKIDDLGTMLKACEGTSVLEKDVPREGVVYRDYHGEMHFKVKSRAYKVWYDSL